jgi:hypothetical protein
MAWLTAFVLIVIWELVNCPLFLYRKMISAKKEKNHNSKRG